MYALVHRYRSGDEYVVAGVYLFKTKMDAENYNETARFPNPEFNVVVWAYEK